MSYGWSKIGSVYVLCMYCIDLGPNLFRSQLVHVGKDAQVVCTFGCQQSHSGSRMITIIRPSHLLCFTHPPTHSLTHMWAHDRAAGQWDRSAQPGIVDGWGGGGASTEWACGAEMARSENKAPVEGLMTDQWGPLDARMHESMRRVLRTWARELSRMYQNGEKKNKHKHMQNMAFVPLFTHNVFGALLHGCVVQLWAGTDTPAHNARTGATLAAGSAGEPYLQRL